ncbi:hypothetical protein GXW83_06625 [Streptacidiphilus sp. PB12-B1b]|uniref:hypothetical protein n=1 Tax=Streptacidiphilus sp. PB12-B1b TaxID=2705012 RepID=UPI0015F8F8C3|nr:hypothetical protein [Streptacidiphilus sp. PB12-B1b]QMU75468.1 hypothetical protein GXW83_06625 [Streptacidiphilus sp. PB12-B1b]
MTALQLADVREAADLGAFLSRLIRFDKAAAVRLQTAGLGLAVFARLPLGETGPLAVRTARLSEEAPADLTVSAGQLLDAVDALAGTASATPPEAVPAPRTSGAPTALDLPSPITGPAWAGLLPPRRGWEHLGDLPSEPLRAAVRAAITEFRRESADPDALAESIWSRQLHPSGLTLRAVHAAYLVGLLHQAESVALHRHPAWLRLSGPRGYVITRRAPAPGTGLGLTPTR